MWRKGWIWLGALLFAAFSTGTAWAASAADLEPPHPPAPRAVGQVTAVGEDQLTLRLRDGREVTVWVDDHTRFRQIGGGEASLADVEVGLWVAGRGSPSEEGAFRAQVMVLLPQGWDPSSWRGVRVLGRVLEVDPAANRFVVGLRSGKAVRVEVNERTRFRGVSGLEDLQPGVFVAVAGKRQEGGTLLARLVVARQGPQVRRYLGRVTAVHPDAGTFALQTPSGETLTFVVTDRTRYGGQAQGLEDLRPGMEALVGAVKTPQGALQARWVVVRMPREHERAFRGEVVSVGRQALVLRTLSGQEVTLAVTAQTRFGRGLTGLEDLHPGLRVGVLARQTEKGRWEAVAVVGWSRTAEGREEWRP